MEHPTEVFSSIAEDYARYRPSYPGGVLDVLINECSLKTEWAIADIGSGTGNLTRLFLENGNPVTGVEPNGPMRRAGERLLAGYPRFCSLDGTAEAIPIAAGSVDLLTVGQAFHWFDQVRARDEFARVLRTDGWVAIVWNDRLTETDPFAWEYANLMRTCGSRYAIPCNSRVTEAEMESFFGRSAIGRASFPNEQRFDLEGLIGRARSSSYVPQPGQPGSAEMTKALTDLFRRHQKHGQVTFLYRTELRFGRLEDSQ